jgi:DNA-binding transcriptional LysR family regulator
MDKLTSMKVFCRVVTRENFSQAARELRLSPAMVTKHIAALEEQLGIRLLNRTTRRVSATEAGLRYFDSCKRLLSDIEDAEASLSELGSTVSGQLRISAPMDFGVMHLSPAIGCYLNRYPKVQIDIDYQDRRIDLIEEGFDLAIRIGKLPDSSLVSQRIMPSRIVLCAAPAYLEQYGTPQTPQDLRDHNCLTYSYSSTNNDWLFKKGEERFSVKVSGRLNANNGRALVAAAVNGLGIVEKPYFMVQEYLQSGQLVELFEQYTHSEVNIYAVYTHRQFLPAKISTFVAFIKDYFNPQTLTHAQQQPQESR